MFMQLRALDISDYEEVFALWQGTPGIGLNEADEKGEIARYLARNPGMSFVAVEGTRIIGAVLCGHDGRRGFIHHMVVRPECRKSGCGRALEQAALNALAREGIEKCHLFVKKENALGKSFWERLGWQERADLYTFSHDVKMPE
jgi:N-acetylglutamate synthase